MYKNTSESGGINVLERVKFGIGQVCGILSKYECEHAAGISKVRDGNRRSGCECWRAVTSLTPRHLRQAVRKLQITNCMNDFESKYQNHKGYSG
jgi:hypothetical protein